MLNQIAQVRAVPLASSLRKPDEIDALLTDEIIPHIRGCAAAYVDELI
jgi:hypothetical protein